MAKTRWRPFKNRTQKESGKWPFENRTVWISDVDCIQFTNNFRLFEVVLGMLIPNIKKKQ
jgi:hypothetical protein